MKIDATDRKIVEMLALDGSMSATEIAKAIHFSVQSVTKRIEKLRTSGLIERYTIFTDPNLAGKPVRAIVSLVLTSPEYREALVKKISSMENVLFFYAITGEYDFIMEMCATSVEGINQQLMEIKLLPGIQKTFTAFILDSFKSNQTILPVVTK